MTRDDMEWFWDLYLPDTSRRSDLDASPLRAVSFAGLSPAVVVIAGADVFRDEGIAYCDRLRASGVDVAEFVLEGVPHGMVANRDIASTRAPMDKAVAEFARMLAMQPGQLV